MMFWESVSHAIERFGFLRFFGPRTTIPQCPGVQACVVGKGEGFWPREVLEMLWTIFVILLVLWLVGLVSSYTLGGFIHLLLVAAVVVLILQLISGRRPVV
jgi:hypothetical protein